MKSRYLLVVGLGIYVLALVITVPATMVDSVLSSASDGRLRLAAASGTLWSGTGWLELRAAAGHGGISRHLSWRVMPQSLLLGHRSAEVRLGQDAGYFPVTLSFSRIAMKNADISLPAAVLGLAIPELDALGLTGDMQIHVANLSLVRDSIEGTATLHWRTAGSSLTDVAPLGDYELRLETGAEMVHAVLSTIEGPIRLDGNGSWQHGARPVFLGEVYVPPPYRQQLAPLLRLIAVERDEGRFEIRLK